MEQSSTWVKDGLLLISIGEAPKPIKSALLFPGLQ
jgi:hypothetical protein